MRTSTSVRHGGSMIVAAVIIAIGMQWGHAMPPPSAFAQKDVVQVIGRPMYMEIRGEVKAEVILELTKDIGVKLRPERIEEIVTAVRGRLEDGVLKYWKVGEYANPIWVREDGTDERIPPESEKTVYAFFGTDMSEDVERAIASRLTGELLDLVAAQTPITIDVVRMVAEATDDGTQSGLGCWMCIPDASGAERWYNTCTLQWGGPS